MRGGAGMGRGGSKKCKPIPTPPYGAGLKSRPIPAPPPLQGGESPHGAKWGGASQAGRGKIVIPTHRFATSLSGSFRPVCFLKAHLFILWAYDPLFLPLELNSFSIHSLTLLYPYCWTSSFYQTSQNEHQHLVKLKRWSWDHWTLWNSYSNLDH